MSVRHHLSAYDRGRAVGRLEAGQSVTQVATAMGVSKSVISRLKKAAEGGNALRKHAGGRGKSTTSQEDRYISLIAKRNRHLTPGQIASDNCNRYWHSRICQNHFSAIKSGWFICTEIC